MNQNIVQKNKFAQLQRKLKLTILYFLNTIIYYFKNFVKISNQSFSIHKNILYLLH